MKKYLFFALTAVAFMACTNDDNEASDNWNGEIRLSSSNVAVPVSRSLSQDLQLTQFANDEKVDVFVNENLASGQTASTVYDQPLVCTANGSGGLAFAASQYFPQSGNGVNIYAVYPSGKATVVDASAGFSIKTDQSSDEDYMASDLMLGVPESSNPVARTKNNVNLKFTHKLSKIDITLVVGAGVPTLTGATVKLKDLSPTTSFTPNATALSTATGAKTDVIAANGNMDNNLKCSAIIVPQTVQRGAAFIEVTLASGGVLTYKLDKESTFVSGNKYIYNITVNLTELTVTSSIEPWGDTGSTTSGDAEM